ncbi:hypothetical protein J1N35_011739 [Gossypium stocksii]|uniref:Uncharacterized protein n=1 Tax=Gossypium stocksii TaxID=47602 RepID=A0A9D4ADV7_9ROSI|nr:hypothetical protein J1N35_011739 [Gossypium stocksii]
MRVLSIKYRFCALIHLVKYDAFDIKAAWGLEAMVQTYIDSGSLFLKLYVEFSRPYEGIRSSTSLPIREVRTVENADSPTTLLESSYYDILKSSMGRNSSVSTYDFNRGRPKTKKSGFSGRTEYMTPARHLISQ